MAALAISVAVALSRVGVVGALRLAQQDGSGVNDTGHGALWLLAGLLLSRRRRRR